MRNAAVLVGSDVSKTHLDRAVRQSVRLQSNHYSQQFQEPAPGAPRSYGPRGPHHGTACFCGLFQLGHVPNPAADSLGYLLHPYGTMKHTLCRCAIGGQAQFPLHSYDENREYHANALEHSLHPALNCLEVAAVNRSQSPVVHRLVRITPRRVGSRRLRCAARGAVRRPPLRLRLGGSVHPRRYPTARHAATAPEARRQRCGACAPKPGRPRRNSAFARHGPRRQSSPPGQGFSAGGRELGG